MHLNSSRLQKQNKSPWSFHRCSCCPHRWPPALDLHLMPHCHNRAGHCPGSHCYGGCLFPEGSAPRSLKADHQIKALEIKQAWLLATGSCINQIAKEHILFSFTESKNKKKDFFIKPWTIKQAVMWFLIIHRMQKFILLKPQSAICVWHSVRTNISTYGPHWNRGLIIAEAHMVHIYMQNSIPNSCILFATANLGFLQCFSSSVYMLMNTFTEIYTLDKSTLARKFKVC